MTPQAAPHAGRLEAAVTTMLDELEAEQDREAELCCALLAARRRRAELADGLATLLKTLPSADRARHGERLARIERARRVPGPGRGAKACGQAVLTWLARHPSGEVTTADLDAAVAAAGFDRPSEYAAKTLHRLSREGLVVRVGRGRYRVSRRHPKLAALRRAAVAEMEGGG